MEKLFVPSKKRLNNCKFIQYLNENKIPCIVVLEKDDYLEYNSTYKNMDYIVLPESGMGIAYVRNYIKKYAEEQKMKYYWMVDDDVTGIYKRTGTKLSKIPYFELQKVEELFKSFTNAGICSLEYQQLAWSATKPFAKNSYCDVFVFINVELTKSIQYRAYAEGKEDRDFAMQNIKAGFETYRSTEFAFAAPKNGSNKGGLKEIFYELKDREKVCAERMVELWGNEICNVVTKQDGRVDAKINWKKINSNQTHLF